MKDYSCFIEKGRWYRGNLHTHTSLSDGCMQPEDVINLYKSNGYSFLAITDHRVAANLEMYSDDHFLVIPGIELDVSEDEGYKVHHVVGIQKDKTPAVSEECTCLANGEKIDATKESGKAGAQEIINYFIKSNCLAIYAHPVWSRLEFDDFEGLEGYFALEVYNHACEFYSHTGLSDIYWDSLLRRGRKIWGVASDDSHQNDKDYCGGWINVKARGLNVHDITESLLKGSFYASTGPSIYSYGLYDGVIHVDCSPVREIHFVAYEPQGKSFLAQGENLLTSASYKPKGSETYVRVECIDMYGRRAWGNPIFL